MPEQITSPRQLTRWWGILAQIITVNREKRKSRGGRTMRNMYRLLIGACMRCRLLDSLQILSSSLSWYNTVRLRYIARRLARITITHLLFWTKAGVSMQLITTAVSIIWFIVIWTLVIRIVKYFFRRVVQQV